MYCRQSDEARKRTELNSHCAGAEKCECCGMWMSKENLKILTKTDNTNMLVCQDCIIKDY